MYITLQNSSQCNCLVVLPVVIGKFILWYGAACPSATYGW